MTAPSVPPIRWGIAATGGIAGTFATDAQLVPQDAQLVAVASRTLATAEAFAEKHSIPRALGSYAELADADVDVVYVASPHSDHFATSAMLLRAGKHVLCEKPLTTSLAETEALIDIAREHDRFLMEAAWMRCNPLIRLAHDMVRDGDLGQVLHVRASFAFTSDLPDEHRLLNPALGGGAILDLGLYPAHFFDLILGRPRRVFARGRTAATGVDATSSALFDYDGAQAAAYASFEAGAEVVAEIVGTAGRLEIDWFLSPETMRLVTPGETHEFVAHNPGRGYTHQLHEVARCLRAGERESRLVPWGATQSVAAMMQAWRQALDRLEGLEEVLQACG